jgi:hypothetical protein
MGTTNKEQQRPDSKNANFNRNEKNMNKSNNDSSKRITEERGRVVKSSTRTNK